MASDEPGAVHFFSDIFASAWISWNARRACCAHRSCWSSVWLCASHQKTTKTDI